MRKTRRTTLSVVSALGASVLLAVVAAANSYTDNIAGGELPNATATEGQFVGTATGALPGAWYADVKHDPLSGLPDSPASITGGSFKLATAIGHKAVTVTGSFSGGTVTQTSGFDATKCTNQTYAVDGALTNVGIKRSGGSGTFKATLTHYRTLIWWLGCVTYSATVTGQVVLDF
jgi:hypothetical protein